ncbi:MAG: hypothetical protein Q8K26_02020 [Candidatus Gracilibacteria bacterium]|nr:hypothetical protein [Candidatus Gracilibacteria bacterium]
MKFSFPAEVLIVRPFILKARQQLTGVLLLFLILCGIQLLFPSASSARTLTVVFDDSGSMSDGGSQKWEIANYAFQSLVGLLHKDDVLSTNRMSSPAIHGLNITQSGRQDSLKIIRTKWLKKGNDTGTPYEVMHEAVTCAINSSKAKQQATNGRDIDWLVVITDGDFDPKPDMRIVREDARQFVDGTDGNARVIFLLIDKKQNAVADAWENEAEGIVDIRYITKSTIVEEMGKIANLISGRDSDDLIELTKASGNRRAVTFSSPFPIEEISIFEQPSARGLNKVNKILPPGRSASIPFVRYDVASPEGAEGKKFFGTITHGGQDSVLPDGQYTILFDAEPEIKSGSLVVYATPAIDFSFKLKRKNGADLTPDSPNHFTVCNGEELRVEIQFIQAGSQKVFPLDKFDGQLQLTVEAGKKITPKRLPNTDIMAAPLTINGGVNGITVEARYPGYFHLKSRRLSVSTIDCPRNVALEMKGGGMVTVPYTFSDAPILAGEMKLLVGGNGPSGKYLVESANLPQGVQLEIQGIKILPGQPRAEIDLEFGQEIPIKVLRDRKFKDSKESKPTLTISTANKQVQWRDTPTTTFTIKPKRRKIELVSQGLPWTAQADKMKETPPFSLACLVDGSPVTPEEFETWQATGKAEQISLQQHKEKDSFVFAPQPQWWCDCFGPEGEIPVAIEVKSLFPGEMAKIDGVITLPHRFWWVKCRSLALGLLLAGIFIWWLVGIIRKPRFPKGSRVAYLKRSRTEDLMASQPRPRNTDLPGHFFSRWLIPYRAERRVVYGLTFHANRSRHYIVIPRNVQTDAMQIDGGKIDNPGAKDVLLGRETPLEIEVGNNIACYTYEPVG